MRWLAEYRVISPPSPGARVADRVHYTGVLDADAMREEFLKSETYLLCSSIENSPNSLGEPCCWACPHAAGAVGGVPSLQVHGAEGVLFDPEAPGAWPPPWPGSGPIPPGRPHWGPPRAPAPWPTITARPSRRTARHLPSGARRALIQPETR